MMSTQHDSTTMSEHRCPIVGMKFRPPAQGVLDALSQGFPLLLKREPSNAHDENAIGVWVADTQRFLELDEQLVNEKLAGFGFTRDDIVARFPLALGYIPREMASTFAPRVDARGIVTWRGVLAFNVTGQPRVAFALPAQDVATENAS